MNQRIADNLILLYGLSERWTAEEFAKALGCQRPKANRFLADAERRGLIERDGMEWKRTGPKPRQTPATDGGLLFL